MRPTRIFSLAIAFALLAGSAPAFAVDLNPGRPPAYQQNILPQLQQLQSRQNREIYQMQQQYNREQDRAVNRNYRSTPAVPVIRQNCRVTAFGNLYRTVCN